MIECSHFVYTIAPVKEKSTYQITAKSTDLQDSVINELLRYVFPTNVDLTEFNESRSLLLLDDKIAYCRVRNIGLGFDGRDDTLYGHTILISDEDFKKLHFDSRILNDYYLEDPSLNGNLNKLIVEPKDIPIDFDLLEKHSFLLNEVFSALFNKQKTALVAIDENRLIQELLAVLPPSLRKVSFTTFLDEPQKQSKYNLVIIQKRLKRNLQDEFRIINPKQMSAEHQKKNRTTFDESIEYINNIIHFKDTEKLFQLNTNFEKITDSDLKNKLILVTNCSKFSYSADETLKRLYADKILEIIKEFDMDTKKEYFDKVKNYSKQYELFENKIQNVWDPSITLAEALWLLPTRLMVDLYKSFLEPNKKSEKKKDD